MVDIVDRIPKDILYRMDLAYFAEEILGIQISDHHEQWSELVGRNKKLCVQCARDHGKSYFFSFAYAIWRSYYNWTPSGYGRSLGYIFAHTQDQSIKYLSQIKDEIEANPKLRHLLPEKKEVWSMQEIKMANGARIRVRGYGVAVRGGHPCLSYNSKIVTDRGVENIGELAGKKRRILTGTGTWKDAIFWSSGVKTVGVASFGNKFTRDKAKIILTPNHQVLTQDGWGEAGKLLEGQEITVAKSNHNHLFEMMGWLWNDGKYAGGQQFIYFSKKDEEAIPLFSPYFTNNPVAEMGKFYFRVAHKNIPLEIGAGHKSKNIKKGLPVLNDCEQETSWVRGMMSANGTVVRSVRIKLSCRPLVEFIESLLNKYGVKTTPIVYHKDRNGFHSFTLHVHKKSINQYLSVFGFIQSYKTKKATDLSFNFYKYEIFEEKEEVFDFKVIDPSCEEEMSGVVEGVVVHNCWAICDDILDDDIIYSEGVRNKTNDYFFSAITPMVVPGGQLIVVGCVTLDTWVLTKDGPQMIGLLSNEDKSIKQVYEFNKEIYGENGFNVATKYFVNGLCETYKITLFGGLTLEGSDRHPIRVQKGRGPTCRNEVIWKRLDEIKKDDMVLIEIGQEVYGNVFSDVDLAYFMGLWTSEGSQEDCGRLTICSKDKDIVDYLHRNPFGFIFSACSEGRRHRVQNKEFYDKLKGLGVHYGTASFKVVPTAILSGTKDVQAAFIKGFADGDGCSQITKEGHYQIYLSTTSEKLAKGLQAILFNMGIFSIISKQKPGVSAKVKGNLFCFNVRIHGEYACKYMQEIGFTVTHKKKPFPVATDVKKRFFKGVKSVEIGSAETVDFVIPKDHTFCTNGMVSHNTPFTTTDLYSQLQRNPIYAFARFPALSEAGEPLWKNRYNKEALLSRRAEVGSTRFSREYLCSPVSAESTLFPEYMLQKCFDEEHTLGIPTDKQLTIYQGIDLAISANVAADWTVITTLGIDELGCRWILDIQRQRGLSMTDQLMLIEQTARRFKPSLIFIEDNGFQQVFRDSLITNTDLPIQGHTTTSKNKNSLEHGLPTLQVLFENRKIIIPRKTERDRAVTDMLVHELVNFTFEEGKVISVGEHDDMCMSLHIANQATQASTFNFQFVG